MEPKLYKMKFVGFKIDGSGELKRSSPGGIKHHEIRELPLSYARDMWWELVDALPAFVLPDKIHEDSVFIEGVFVPKDTFDDIPVIGLPVSKAPVDEVLYDEMTVKSLKIFIEGRGGKLDRKWKKADLVVEARRIQESLKDAVPEAEDQVKPEHEKDDNGDLLPNLPPEDKIVGEVTFEEDETHHGRTPKILWRKKDMDKILEKDEEVSLEVEPDTDPETSEE